MVDTFLICAELTLIRLIGCGGVDGGVLFVSFSESFSRYGDMGSLSLDDYDSSCFDEDCWVDGLAGLYASPSSESVSSFVLDDSSSVSLLFGGGLLSSRYCWIEQTRI